MIYPWSYGNYVDPGSIISVNDLATTINNYQTSSRGDAPRLLNESFGDYEALKPLPFGSSYDFTKYLKSGSAFYMNMQTNSKYLQNDATSLFTLVNNNYFGYPFTMDITIYDPYSQLIFGNDPNNPVVQTQAQIITNMKTYFSGATVRIIGAIKYFLKNPGKPPATNLSALVDKSWLAIELNAQNTKIVISAHSLYELIANYYIGYSLENTSDPLFSILFPANTTPGTPANNETTILSLLKAQKAQAFALLNTTINDPQTPITNVDDLKSGSWLQTELNEQTNKFDHDITTIYTIMEQNYFGYAWGLQDIWLNLLFVPGTNEDLPNSSLVGENQFRINVLFLYGPPNKTNIYQNISLTLNNPGVQTTNPNLDNLNDGRSLKTNLQNQANNLLTDATSLFNIVSNNYFGYSLNDPTYQYYSIFFGQIIKLPIVQNTASIELGIKKINIEQKNIYSFIKEFLSNPGIATQSINDLTVSSWLSTELNAQNTKIKDDVNVLYNILLNTFFGYSIDDTNNSLYSVIFNSGYGNTALQDKASITNNLKSMQANVYTHLLENLDGAGTANAALRLNSWLANEITSQTTSLGVDATSLFNLVNINYFGYPITLASDQLFPVLFSQTADSPVAKTEQEVFSGLINLKGDAHALISQTIKTPGILVSDVSQLKDGSWLKKELNIQETSLITALTTSISKFYDVFKSSFLGKNFNANSFDGAAYVLLFFDSDKNNNLSLGINPSEVANTFTNNLIIQLKENPNFQFPTSANKQLGAIKSNSINVWINTLFTTDNDGKVTLAGDLANFITFQARDQVNPYPTSTKNNLGLILGITIPLFLITLGIGGYLMCKKVLQPKMNKNVKK